MTLSSRQRLVGVNTGARRVTRVHVRPMYSRHDYVLRQTRRGGFRFCLPSHLHCASTIDTAVLSVNLTRSSAVAEGPRDAPCLLKLCEISQKNVRQIALKSAATGE